MSVINQMLRDLETRDGDAVENDLSGSKWEQTAAVSIKKHGWVSSGMSVVLIGLLSVAAIVWLPSDDKSAVVTSVHLNTQEDPMKVTTVIPANAAWETANEAIVADVQVNSGIEQEQPKFVPNKRVALSEWRVDTSDSVTLLEIDLASEITYDLKHTPGVVTLRLHDSAITQSIAPLALRSTPIASLNTESDGTDLVMRFNVNGSVQSQIYGISQGDGAYRLLLTLQESNHPVPARAKSKSPFDVEPAAAESSATVMNEKAGKIGKVERKLTAAEMVDAALLELAQSDTDEAWLARENLSRKAIQDMPEHTHARLTLAQALINRDAGPEAGDVLQVGLEYEPTHLGLHVSLAEQKVHAGDYLGAIALLQGNLPAAASAPDYLAYLAALYRSQGQNTAAVSLYRRALSQKPEEGVWWMGLGISLEGAEASSRYALQAYLKAESLTRTQPNLNSFVAQRVAQLSGQ